MIQLDELPPEIWDVILSNFGLADILSLRLVSGYIRHLVDLLGYVPIGMQLYRAVINEDETKIENLKNRITHREAKVESVHIIEAINSDNILEFSTFTHLLELDKLDYKSREALLLECRSRLEDEKQYTSDMMKNHIVNFAMRLMRTMNYVYLKKFEIIFCMNLGYHDKKIIADIEQLLQSSDHPLVEDGIFTLNKFTARLNCLYSIFNAINEMLTVTPSQPKWYQAWSNNDKQSVIIKHLQQAQTYDAKWYAKWITYFNNKSLTQEQNTQFRRLAKLLIAEPKSNLRLTSSSLR